MKRFEPYAGIYSIEEISKSKGTWELGQKKKFASTEKASEWARKASMTCESKWAWYQCDDNKKGYTFGVDYHNGIKE